MSRESLGRHREGEKLDRTQKAQWWESRQDLDDELLDLLSKLEVRAVAITLLWPFSPDELVAFE